MRREALARRDALEPGIRIEGSIAIAERAMAIPVWADRHVLGGYLPIRSEVDPRPLMALAADRRIRLAAPAIVGSQLDFRALERDGVLERQPFGTYAPGEAAERLVPDVLLVPLAAFDRRGHRIGYGGGFYDRAIAALRDAGRGAITIGVAFAAQEVSEVPDEAFDIALDWIVTESEIVRP